MYITRAYFSYENVISVLKIGNLYEIMNRFKFLYVGSIKYGHCENSKETCFLNITKLNQKYKIDFAKYTHFEDLVKIVYDTHIPLADVVVEFEDEMELHGIEKDYGRCYKDYDSEGSHDLAFSRCYNYGTFNDFLSLEDNINLSNISITDDEKKESNIKDEFNFYALEINLEIKANSKKEAYVKVMNSFNDFVFVNIRTILKIDIDSYSVNCNINFYYDNTKELANYIEREYIPIFYKDCKLNKVNKVKICKI